MDQLLYGSYNLSGSKCHISSTNERTVPKQVIEQMDISRRDGSLKIGDRYSDKDISIEGTLKLPANDSVNNFPAIVNEFKNAFSKKQRYFRRCDHYIKMWDVDSATGWTGGSDTVNITTDSYNYQVSNKSLNFDIDVSWSANDYAEIYNSSLTSVNLSSVEETGNIEFWIFLEDAQRVTSIDIRIGSDASNYWEGTSISLNYEENVLETGWNYISVDWSTMTQVLNPVSSTLTYFYLKINYISFQDDSQNNKLNGIRWIDEERCKNYLVDSLNIDMPEVSNYKTFIPFKISLLSTEGFSLSTFETHIVERDTQTSASKQIEVRLEGNYKPEPRITFTLNTVSSLESIQFENETTNENITIGTNFTTNDILTIDIKELTCLLNGDNVEYEGVFPRFIIGLNKIRTKIITTGTSSLSQTTKNGEFYQLPDDNHGYFVAQTFTPTINCSSITGTIYCYKDAFTYGTTIYLYTDNAGNPGTVLTSVTFDPTLTWDNISFSLSANLTLGSVYWLIIKAAISNPLMMNTAIHIGKNTSGGYAGGSAYDIDQLFPTTPPLSGWTNYSGTDLVFSITQNPVPADLNYDWDIYYKKKYI